MTVVGLCATPDADRRQSFHRSVVAPGTADISLEILGSFHACLFVGDGHTGGRFYCSGGYPDILPPVLPPRNRCNFGEIDIAGPLADSAPCIWVVSSWKSVWLRFPYHGRMPVKHVIFALFHRVVFRLAYRAVTPHVAVHGGTPGIEANGALYCLPKLTFFVLR